MSRTKYEAVYKETYNEVPAGGTTAYVLKKASDTDYDVEWGIVTGFGTDFPSLSDTPANYTGSADKVVTVNATEDGLEFTTPSSGGGLTEDLELGEDLALNDYVKIEKGLAYKRNLTMGYSSYTDATTNNLGAYNVGIAYDTNTDDDNFVTVFKDGSDLDGFGANAYVGCVSTLNQSTNLITKGIRINLSGTDTVSAYYIHKMSANRFLFLYSIAGTSTKAVLLGVSGTTLSILDTLTIDANYNGNFSCTNFSSTSTLLTMYSTVMRKVLIDMTADTLAISSITNTTSSYFNDELIGTLTETDYIVSIGYVSGTGLVATTFNRTGTTTLVETGQATLIGDVFGGNIYTITTLNSNNVLVSLLYSNVNSTISYVSANYLTATHLAQASSSVEVVLINDTNEFHWEHFALKYIEDDMYCMSSINYLKDSLVLNYFILDTTALNIITLFSSSSTVLCKNGLDTNRPVSYGVSKLGDKLVVIAGDDDDEAGSDVQYDVVVLDRYSPLKLGTKYGYATEIGSLGETKAIGIMGVS